MSVTRTNEVRMLDDIGKAGFTFDSVEDMKQSTAVVVGQKVRTLGYYAPGDGGGCDYEIVAAATGTDDGGSFIDLAGSGTQAKGLFGGSASIKQFGYVGETSDSFLVLFNADAFAQSSGLPLRLENLTISTDGKNTFSEGVRVISVGATIKRLTTDYLGSDPILEISSDVTIEGDLTFDGNKPSEVGEWPEGFPSVRVVGDRVKADVLRFINTPSPSLGTKQLRGCIVEGDYFDCNEVYGDGCGYATLQLRIEKPLNRFRIGYFESINHNFKGFQVNSFTTDKLKTLIIESIYTASPVSILSDASEGMLIDSAQDNTLLQVDNMFIGYAHLSGGNSNCLKVQNVNNFYCGYMFLDVVQNYAPGEAMRMHAKNCHIETLVYNDKQIRLYSLNSYFGEVRAEHPDTYSNPNVFRFNDTTPGDTNYELLGARYHTIEKMHVVNSPGISFVFGFQHTSASELHLDLKECITPGVPVFASYDVGAGGPDARRGGKIKVGKVSGVKFSQIIASNELVHVQIGQRLFSTVSGAPTVGVFEKGDYIRNLNASVIDPSGANYIDKGYICTQGGDETTFIFEVDRLFL